MVRSQPVDPAGSAAPGPASRKLSELIRIPTVADAGDRSSRTDAGDELRRALHSLFPRSFELLQVETDGPDSLLLVWRGSRPELDALALCAHWDVVPADDSAAGGWTFDPFGGRIDDSFVWGRGAIDDKLSLVAILQAVELLIESGWSPSRTVCICLGGDEETGGDRGAARNAALLERLGITLGLLVDEGAVVAEGMFTMVDRPIALVGVSEKGHVNILISVPQEAGHASMPPRQSAAGLLALALQRIERSPFPARLTFPMREMLRAASKAMRPLPALICAHPGLFSRILLRVLSRNVATNALIRTTQAVTMLRGASAPNVLPDAAEAVVNVRILPGESVASALEHLRAAVNDPRVSITLLPGGDLSEPVPASDIRTPAYRSVAETIGRLFPDALCAPFLVTGSTDSRHYRRLTRNIFRFTPVVLHPADLKRIHGVDERVSHIDIKRAVEFYRELIISEPATADR
ncbi:M20/M25/M40 family metallo-hydrolase [Salinispira pacifica]